MIQIPVAHSRFRLVFTTADVTRRHGIRFAPAALISVPTNVTRMSAPEPAVDGIAVPGYGRHVAEHLPGMIAPDYESLTPVEILLDGTRYSGTSASQLMSPGNHLHRAEWTTQPANWQCERPFGQIAMS
ncbi:hypothetical protein, partial [Paraburkholderia silviterrae]